MIRIIFGGIFFIYSWCGVFATQYVFAETFVVGDIEVDEVWTADNSPYIIENSITIPEGATLSVQSGVEIEMGSGVSVFVEGSLVLEGNSDEHIVINPYSENDEENYSGYYGGFVFSENASGSFSYVDISYADIPLLIDFGTNFVQSHITLENNIYNGIGLGGESFGKDISLQESTLPYVLFDSVSIGAGYMLSLDAGVILKPASSSISFNIFGKVEFLGTGQNPISVTSLSDDSLGGDTNNDGGTSPLEFFDDGFASFGIFSSEESTFDYVNFKYMGGEIFAMDANVSIRNSVFEGRRGGVSGFHSDFDITNTSFRNTSGSSVALWGESSLSLTGGGIQNTLGVTLYNQSTGNISNVEMTDCVDVCLSIFNNTSLTLRDVELSGGIDGITVFNGSTLDAEDVETASMLGSGIFAFGSEGINTLSIKGSEIQGNLYGVFIANMTTVSDFVQNRIYDNTEYGVFVYEEPEGDLDFRQNWWGDRSGPTHANNSGGEGDLVSNFVMFDPWLRSDPVNGRDPVIIIPGIMGTRIIQNHGDFEEVWPNANKLVRSFTDAFMSDLALDLNGEEREEYPMTVGDIIRSESVTLDGDIVRTDHVFDGFIETLVQDGYVEGEDLFVFPYDWRLSNRYTANILKEKIDAVLLDSGREKIDIVAHSMGGLVAKTYIAEYGESDVDQLFFIGTPHLGAPKAFKALMYGDDMGLNKFGLSLLSNNRIKEISQNMSSLFQLIPSRAYVDTLGKRYVGKNEKSTGLINAPLEYNYFDYDSARAFLEDNDKNQSFIDSAEQLHEDLDTLDLSGIRSYNFSGCGVPTLDAIKLKKKKSRSTLGISIIDDYELSFTHLGDQTVPLASSVGVWGDQYYVYGETHGSLPHSSSIRGTILALLSGQSASVYEDLSQSATLCAPMALKAVSVHSPVSLHVYDEEGNHVGPTEDGVIEYEIPGVGYETIEDVKYAIVPETGTYRFVFIAEDIGSFDVFVDSYNTAGEKTESIFWGEIPIENIELNGQLLLSTSTDEYVLQIDTDGDTSFEQTITPSSYSEELDEPIAVVEQTYSVALVPTQNYQEVVSKEEIKINSFVEEKEVVADITPEESIVVDDEIEITTISKSEPVSSFDNKENEEISNDNQNLILASVSQIPDLPQGSKREIFLLLVFVGSVIVVWIVIRSMFII